MIEVHTPYDRPRCNSGEAYGSPSPSHFFSHSSLPIKELIESDGVLLHQGVADCLNNAHHYQKIGIPPWIVDPVQKRGNVPVE